LNIIGTTRVAKTTFACEANIFKFATIRAVVKGMGAAGFPEPELKAKSRKAWVLLFDGNKGIEQSLSRVPVALWDARSQKARERSGGIPRTG